MRKRRTKKRRLLLAIIVLALLGYTLFNVGYYLSAIQRRKSLKKTKL